MVSAFTTAPFTPISLSPDVTAGYCVMTYLLGVGDRHLDNLLLAPDGTCLLASFGKSFTDDHIARSLLPR